LQAREDQRDLLLQQLRAAIYAERFEPSGEIRLDGVEQAVPVPAWQGEHNAEILAELGYGDEQIETLLASGTLIQSSRSVTSEDAAGMSSAQR
jgi:crotonobetainyl-CoA:carnitine CoA-transferase CaiB-like acyl-CoA transferase